MMAVTLNELLMGVAREGALQAPSSFPSNPNPEQTQALANINATLTHLITSYRLFFMMTKATFNITQGKQRYTEAEINLPCFELASVASNAYYLQGTDKPLGYIDYTTLDTWGIDLGSGEPTHYTIEGNQFVLSHTPNKAYVCTVRYYQQYIGQNTNNTKLTELTQATDTMVLPDRWKRYVILQASALTYRSMNAGDAKYVSLLQLADQELKGLLSFMQPAGRDTVTQIVPHYQERERHSNWPFGTIYQ